MHTKVCNGTQRQQLHVPQLGEDFGGGAQSHSIRKVTEDIIMQCYLLMLIP
eukprot:m.114116 g.114116  ORF g.114116 m.114116 type:complete len:51 (-) comp12810_c0_seq4:91-243(-)